jgi:hypothetical protein
MTEQTHDVVGPTAGGRPASGSGSPIVDMLAADFDDQPRSVHMKLLDEALAAPRVHRTKVEQWVEDNGFNGGHWVEVVG